jgi:hypothetical protein
VHDLANQYSYTEYYRYEHDGAAYQHAHAETDQHQYSEAHQYVDQYARAVTWMKVACRVLAF